MRIILAEDEAAIRSLLAKGLRRSGAEVTECETVAAALAAAGAGFDAAVLDANLPDGSGIDAAAHFCRINPAARIVICSGLPVSVEDTGLGPAARVSTLAKPFRIAQLLGALGLG